LLQAVPAKLAVIDRLSREYLTLTRTGADPARQRMLASQIQNLDTCVRLAREGPGLVARIIHLYYGCGFDSVGVGSELGISPTLVRQTIFRLNRLAERQPARDSEQANRRGRERKHK